MSPQTTARPGFPPFSTAFSALVTSHSHGLGTLVQIFKMFFVWWWMCIFRASYFFLGPGGNSWAPFGFSGVVSYASSVCTYCSLFPGISSALTLPLCLPGSRRLFLMMICWKAIITISAIITIITIITINIIITWSKPAYGQQGLADGIIVFTCQKVF